MIDWATFTSIAEFLAADRIFRFAPQKVEAIKVRFRHARFTPAVEEAVLLELPEGGAPQ